MKCPHCAAENEETAKFCGHCGQSLHTHTAQPQPEAHVETAATSTQSKGELTINADMFSVFWEYVKQSIKTPSLHESQLQNGIISLLLFSIFLPMSIVHALNQLFHQFTTFLGNSSGDMSPIFTALTGKKDIIGFGVTFKAIVTLIICIAVYALIMYLCLKFAKAQVSYSEIIARFGTMGVPLMVLSLVLLLLSYVNLSLFLAVLLLVSIGIQVMFFFTMYKFSENAHLDAFYLALICHGIYSLIIYFAMKSYIWDAIQSIGQFINYLNNY